jgi:hypothetical protein
MARWGVTCPAVPPPVNTIFFNGFSLLGAVDSITPGILPAGNAGARRGSIRALNPIISRSMGKTTASGFFPRGGQEIKGGRIIFIGKSKEGGV